jgi:hypothetical protein
VLSLRCNDCHRADEGTYGGVGGGELLLVCRDDSTAALGGVQRTLALDNSLAGSSSATTSAAANLGNGVPVFRHVDYVLCVVVRKSSVSCGKAE